MCFGNGDAAKRSRLESARQQRELERREIERQAAVRTGTDSINTAFSRFNDDFFNTFATDQVNSQLPDLDQQFADARGRLVAALAGRRIKDSTVGADALADLKQADTDTRARIGNDAQDAANRLRGTVEGRKSELFRLNEASANPASINAQALGSASTLVAPQATSPLGNVFAAALEPFVAASNARNNRSGPRFQSPVVGLPPASGSGRVVG